jgi:VWFA-related protein
VLGPEDLVAVVSFDGVQARLLAPWTASRPALAEGLRQAREASPQGFVFASTVDSEIGALRQEARELREEAQTASRRGTTMRQRTFGEMQSCTAIEVLEGKLERLVSGISAVLRSLPRPPGRRVALLLSGGWPRSVEKMLTSGGPILSGCDSRGAAIYQPLYETANLLGYTLYPVDVPLPSGGLVSAADADGIAEREDSDYVAATAMQSATVEGELHATLGRLALETGGRALLDGDSRHALERVAADTESYYWLGFSPDRQADDEDHRLEVRVLRPGLEARHRRGFRDLSVQAEVDHATEGLLLFDLPGGAVPLDLEVGPIPAGRRPVVPLRVSIPLAGVAFLPAGGALQAELELRIATLDEAGRRSDLARVPLVLRAATAPAAGERTVQEIPLRIRRGSQVLAVTLHDPASRVLMAGRVVIVP